MNKTWLLHLNFDFKLNIHQGCPEITSNQIYYVKVQSIPSPADFELTRGMNLQAWHLQVGCCVLSKDYWYSSIHKGLPKWILNWWRIKFPGFWVSVLKFWQLQAGNSKFWYILVICRLHFEICPQIGYHMNSHWYSAHFDVQYLFLLGQGTIFNFWAAKWNWPSF